MYSYRVEQAIRATTLLHKGQVRRGPNPLPYVSHPFAVALIVSDYTDDEDTIVAALLHDTLEDTDYQSKEIEEDFGKSVRTIVETISEPGAFSEEALTWKQSKAAYAKQLKKASEEALLVAAADKIHNMRCMIEDYYNDHVRLTADFKGSLDDRLMMYQTISNVLNGRLKNDIIAEFNLVHEEYKNFILDVKTTTKGTAKKAK